MAVNRRQLPLEWEERWRREKERRRRLVEEGGAGVEQYDRELQRIIAFNDARMGLAGGRSEEEEGSEVRPGGAVYHSRTFPTDVFRTLKDFLDSSVLTDLTLTSVNGNSLDVHSVVVAAVSSFILDALRDQHLEPLDADVRRCVQVGVDDAGLRAVVEFAYTGGVSSLNGDTAAPIRTAARELLVPRLLDLCNLQEGQKRPLTSQEQMWTTLQSIERLWADRVGCDLTLDVDGSSFPVHRVLLAASSDYFRGMFTSGMRESHQSRVALPFLFAPEFGALLGFCYSGSIRLSWDSVFEVTCTALQLQFRPALSLCFDFMRQEMQSGSCLDVASFAEAYGMSELLEEAEDFVLRNFREVSATEKFLDLPAEKLLGFIGSDGLCVPSELTVFRAVSAWIQADPEGRLPQAGSLMTGVRFPLMTFREFREVRAINLRMECSGNEEVELYGSALKEFGFGLPKSAERCRVRRPRDALLVVGGDRLNPDVGQRIASREVWFANSLRSGTGLVKEVEWRKLAEIPDKPKFRHAVAALQGKLFVAGGCFFYAKDDVMKSAYSYDPATDAWKRLADMQEFRSSFSLVPLEERLYAIGGDKELNANLDSVEMYDPHKDSWSFVKPLDRTLSGHAAAVLNDAIFISGGFNCKYECLASLSWYHPERGTVPLSDMSRDRAQHCMEALKGRLYVSGGVCNLRAFYTDQPACEVYDPAAGSWADFAPLPRPHVGAASAVLEDRVYVLGGYCQEDYSESGLVHRFDPGTLRWETVGNLPGAVTDIRACLLRLPQHLRQ